MDFADFTDSISSFYQSHQFIAIVIAILFVFLIFRRPKFILSLFLLALILAGVIYLIFDAASSGIFIKEKLIDKSEFNGIQNR
ncbi:MAG: hypothetical protein AB1632_00640 [Nitrospirota bacterium]